MKIYFPKVMPQMIHTGSFEKLDKYFCKKEIYQEIYSDEGIFIVDNKNIYKKKIIDEEVISINKYVMEKDILIDYSKEKLEDSYQIPFNHKHFINIKVSYLVNPRSHIKLFIIMSPNENWVNDYLDKNDFYLYCKVIDIYFEVQEHIDIYGVFCKNEINELLSLIV